MLLCRYGLHVGDGARLDVLDTIVSTEALLEIQPPLEEKLHLEGLELKRNGSFKKFAHRLEIHTFRHRWGVGFYGLVKVD